MSKPSRQEDAGAEWFVRAFGEDYLTVYAQRDEAEARLLLRTLRDRFGLTGPVLDLACGPGRFLRGLEAEGVPAYGLDLSGPLLRRARTVPGGSPARLIRSDMRSLPFRSGSFPWVVLLFTSFGYFDREEEDRSVLTEISRVLLSGGTLVLDFLNAERTVRGLVPDSRREVSGRTIRETRWVDPDGPYLRKRIEVGGRGGEEGKTAYEERVRLYRPEQLAGLLRRAGLKPAVRLGDYGGGVFQEETSPRCLLLGCKGAEA